jgi:hypothetical protein
MQIHLRQGMLFSFWWLIGSAESRWEGAGNISNLDFGLGQQVGLGLVR